MKQKLLFFIVALIFTFSSYSQTSIINQVLDCSTGCSDLTINFTEISETSDYSVESIPFNPPSNFNGLETPIFFSADDAWGNVVDLPFNFNFFSENYNELVFGTNGVITFDVSLAGGFNWYLFTEPLPNNTNLTLSEANIFGAGHDLQPLGGTREFGYQVFGEAPFRYFVVSYYNVLNFGCNDLRTTQMTVLYETTNVVEVYLLNKPFCENWNDGNSVVGIQNPEGTEAVVPPGRNTGQWTAESEAWRFIPIGSTTDNTYAWYDDTGALISTNETINVCPTMEETYTAEVTYIDASSGSLITFSESITLTTNLVVENPNSIELCSDTEFAVFDLTIQTNVITGGSTCSTVTYYESLTDAQNNTNVISNPNSYTNTTNPQMIFVRVENGTTGSYETTEFDLIVNSSFLECNDIAVYLIPFIPPRPGLNYSNTLIIDNLGFFPVSGSVGFTHDSSISFVEVLNLDDGNNVVPTTTGFILNFNNLLPGDQEVVDISLNVPASSIAGDLLTNSVEFNVSDINIDNNASVLTQVVVNSYDPNNKVESHGREIKFDDFTNNDFLFYTIRFQNLGTADALNVRIEDVLDSQLDETTFKMLSASHYYALSRLDDQLTWRFNNINLPPVSESESESHGYVFFKIKPLAGFEVGDIIPNTADIFFDINDPVTTNTFETEFVANLSVEELSSSSYSMYPNPANTIVNVQFNNNISESVTVSIFDIQGKLVLTINSEIESNTIQFDVSGLSHGMYFVELKGDNFKTVEKLIIE